MTNIRFSLFSLIFSISLNIGKRHLVQMTDISFSFRDIFVLLVVFGFELMLLLQGIKYYKTGELIVGFRSQDVLWREFKAGDFFQAIMGAIFGSILFIFFNVVLLGALIAQLIGGIIFFSLHDLGLYLILRWYWKKKTIEANQKEAGA
jgi:hypothetical protein